MRRVLIVGATSAIAEATAREFARRGDALFLAGRNAGKLGAIADDLKIRGARTVGTGVFDVHELGSLAAIIDQAHQCLGGLDFALIAHGTLSDQAVCQASAAEMAEQFQINALSVMAICTGLANRFEEQGSGVIAVISSVAGDRGRQSNYVYGSAKAAVSAFTSGLRQRLHARNVRVVTIKPGFVDTPMTAAFKKGILWAEPAQVGKSIFRAMVSGRAVVYVPWFWRPIMTIITSIPEVVFQRLKL